MRVTIHVSECDQMFRYVRVLLVLCKCKRQAYFKPLIGALADNEELNVAELTDCQGKPVDIGGYYKPDEQIVADTMQPSETLNALIDP